jgi:hypothetical protein
MFCRSEKKEVKVLLIFLLICVLHTNASTTRRKSFWRNTLDDLIDPRSLLQGWRCFIICAIEVIRMNEREQKLSEQCERYEDMVCRNISQLIYSVFTLGKQAFYMKKLAASGIELGRNESDAGHCLQKRTAFRLIPDEKQRVFAKLSSSTNKSPRMKSTRRV